MSHPPDPIDLPVGLEFLRRLRLPHKIGILERVYSRALSAHGAVPVRLRDGTVWRLNLRSASMRRAVFDDYLGSGVTRWVKRWLANGGLVIDVGANVGQTVCLFASLPKTRTLAIDPNPACIEWIRECLTWYPAWNVQVFNCGLSDVPGVMELHLPEFEGEEGAQATLRADWYVDRGKKTIPVPVNRLDDLLQNDDRVRLWKLDVEGWEHKVLEGARDTLMSGRVEALFAEVHPSHRDYFRRTMHEANMDLFDVNPDGRLVRIDGPLPPQIDYLAIHRSALHA